MLENKLIICNEPYKKHPDKVIDLTPELKVTWVYDKRKEPYKLIGFTISIEGK